MKAPWVLAHAEQRPAEACIPDERLVVASASKEAYAAGRLTEDIRAEQDKLDWADAVVLQFPLWWYGTPPF